MPSVLSEVRRSYTPEQETMIIEALHGALATRCAFRRSRPLVPIDRDQCEGAVRCIF